MSDATDRNSGAAVTNPQSDQTLLLGIEGFEYADLYEPLKLRALAECFYAQLERDDDVLHGQLTDYIAKAGVGYEQKAESAILLAAAPHLARFIATLFNIETEWIAQIRAVQAQDDVWTFKQFIWRRAVKKVSAADVAALDTEAINAAMVQFRGVAFPDTLACDDELGIARAITRLLEWEKYCEGKPDPDVGSAIHTSVQLERCFHDLAEGETGALLTSLQAMIQAQDAALDHNTLRVRTALRLFETWAAMHVHDAGAKQSVRGWVSFKTAHAVDYENLVQIQRPFKDLRERMRGLDQNLRHRDGFGLTDNRYNARQVLNEVDYCLYCHERSKDSCSKGLRDNAGQAKRNPLGIKLDGCPLDEKISEMHLLKKAGDSIAALAIVMIDNPMCPGTGHRICNDCMKACIFQKQEPVNIPQAETGVLTDVLNMSFGFEIYSLLTRWNPLNAARPYALPYNGKNVLVVGLGPSGYTLAHYLLNEGFGVVGIDGLKIEPPNEAIAGVPGERVPRPVRGIADMASALDQRILAGFGGVSEYGITVRWDKNFLTMIHVSLARRTHFRFYGGIRFGGTLDIDDAWSLGFDHIAIATGAGKPTIVDMKQNLIRGIRKASDFLMALQLTGAFKRDNLANLQVRLPALVIGGGLTAIDTATELFAYYPVQVEKILERHIELTRTIGEAQIWSKFDTEESAVYTEFLDHGRAVKAERERARSAGTNPDFVTLVRNWGGVAIAYRKRLQDSPAYRLNHEEVHMSLEEGIDYIENMSPAEALADDYGAVKAIVFERQRLDQESGKWQGSGEMVEVPARSVCVAAGTSPNIIYEREMPGTFTLDERKQFFQPHVVVADYAGNVSLQPAAKGERAFFTSYNAQGKLISYYGDNHPVYAGNVVKAMASAKHGYSHVAKLFAHIQPFVAIEEQQARSAAFNTLVTRLEDQITATVVRVERLTSTIVDVVVRAPFQARKFKPGQFYRLQNYESTAKLVNGSRLAMEGIALTGAWVDYEAGLLSLIVLEMGVSSRLCAALQPGERVVVMGPTGTPTEIPANETVMLVGGGLGNAVLFSIGKALKRNGCRVIYFAGYRKGEDLFKREEIEADTDQVIWSTDSGAAITPDRPHDAHFRGNIVEAMAAYARGELGQVLVDLQSVQRLIVIGSDRMMAAVKRARHGVLAPYLNQQHVAVGSINSPMQCMMKEVCAQCLQRHVDPVTGKEQFVFSCFNQDQYLDLVDFDNLNARLRANSVQEKLSDLWLDNLLTAAELKLV